MFFRCAARGQIGRGGEAVGSGAYQRPAASRPAHRSIGAHGRHDDARR